LDWKDTLLPGASRQALPWTLNGPVQAGYAGDSNPDPLAGYQQRNDWVMGPGGRPVISGSSEAQPGAEFTDPFYVGSRGYYGANVAPSLTPEFQALHPVSALYPSVNPAVQNILADLAAFADRGYVDSSATGFGQPETPELYNAFLDIINRSVAKKRKKTLGTRVQVPT
jgi:hypothetical protein